MTEENSISMVKLDIGSNVQGHMKPSGNTPIKIEIKGKTFIF